VKHCFAYGQPISILRKSISLQDYESACIEWCPEEALDLVTKDRRAQKAGEKADLFSV
jgi:Fe-S-cluster-containing hydrogenase component 2